MNLVLDTKRKKRKDVQRYHTSGNRLGRSQYSRQRHEISTRNAKEGEEKPEQNIDVISEGRRNKSFSRMHLLMQTPRRTGVTNAPSKGASTKILTAAAEQ